MSTAEIAETIAEAEKRIDAMQLLCEILTGQIKGTRWRLEEIKSALGPARPPNEMEQPADLSAAMLEG
ncbi:MAG: hypothetical protein ABSD29_16825 [Verrucomicrobiota bacterium]|jgi:hypothetical protein